MTQELSAEAMEELSRWDWVEVAQVFQAGELPEYRLGSKALESELGPEGCGKWYELELKRARANVGLLVTGEGSGA